MIITNIFPHVSKHLNGTFKKNEFNIFYINTFLFKIKKEDKKHSSRKKLLTIKEKKKK